ncbi:MAG: hypothetical protein HYX61_10160 [Gammaproteobacteria bacterium]|nr:hypothetical protein [Gammaproteobacteria bacterium]
MKLSDLIPSRAKILSLAAQTAGACAIATGFFYSGYLSSAVSLLAKTGIVLSAEIFATQVAVSAAIGLLSVVAANAVWYTGKGVYNWFAGTQGKPKPAQVEQTDEERYNKELKETKARIKALKDKSVRCTTVLRAFKVIINKAGQPHFDENGMLTENDQPIRNVLQLTRWKEKRFQEIVNTRDIHECAVLKNSIPEKGQHKLETPSKKPLFS